MPWPTSLVVKNGSKAWPQHLPGHAGAIVGDRQQHVLTGDDFLVRAGISLVEEGVGGLDCHPAAIRHRVARVDRKVDNRAFQLAAVGGDRPETTGKHRLDLDRFIECPPQQLGHAGDQAIEVQSLWRQGLAAGKGEKLLGQRRRALGAADRRLDLLPAVLGGDGARRASDDDARCRGYPR